MFVCMQRATSWKRSRLVPGSVIDVPESVAQRWLARGIARVAESVEAPLPDTFPGRAALIAAGITTIPGVPRDVDDLTRVPGIGTATARRVLASLG